MAESKTKKIRRFKHTQNNACLKIIQLRLTLKASPYLTDDQESQINGQINKLKDKIMMYERKINNLSNSL